MSRLRLLKVIVQPVFVEDDGENLTERPTDAKAIAAAEWPEFVAGFEQSMAELMNSNGTEEK